MEELNWSEFWRLSCNEEDVTFEQFAGWEWRNTTDGVSRDWIDACWYISMQELGGVSRGAGGAAGAAADGRMCRDSARKEVAGFGQGTKIRCITSICRYRPSDVVFHPVSSRTAVMRAGRPAQTRC